MIFSALRGIEIWHVFENFVILLRFITYALIEALDYKKSISQQWRSIGGRKLEIKTLF